MKRVICDKGAPARTKVKVYMTVVRPAIMYGLEVMALTKRQEAGLEVAELKMLSFSMGTTVMDRFENEYISGTSLQDGSET